ncbi:30S ribosomal protein S16 [Candidatus Peregrinibacteria bacterium CG10_big_fil_rev_8_21_14_0_10_42_8]|nr:MAG: 30S ribosomal protein S16 [Candidatus Peregrinibacteria bacterium CG10_big_fil_rev_8_21_14_0_10_42_8]
MLRIRLQRTGNKNNPTYRIVVADKRNAAKGKFNEILGHYLPTRDPSEFVCNTERAQYWMSMGAVPSDTLARLLTKNGMKGLEKHTERYSKKKKKNPSEEEIAAEAAKNAPKEEAPAPVETPIEEAPVAEEAPKETVEAPAEEEKKEEPASAEATADKDDK